MTYRSICKPCELLFEWESARMTADDPPCPECSGPTERSYFPVGAIWTKALVEYADKSKDTYQKDLKNGGHWTYEKNSDAAQSAGKPLPVFIQTPKQQAEYCKREGLYNPKDLPSNMNIAKDGRSYETANRSEI